MKAKTVLVIEDNDMNMQLMRAFLEIGKYRILEAREAETGIHLAREYHPDLILMDIQLPGMDGLSATRIIKEDPDLKNIPILATTGLAMHDEVEKGLESGFSGYIIKPCGVQEILKTLARFLDDH
jgi:two-component system, cell cycle response regulator DivK